MKKKVKKTVTVNLLESPRDELHEEKKEVRGLTLYK